MKYLLLIYSEENPAAWEAMSEAEQQALIGEYRAVSALPNTLGSNQLQPAATATTVRVNDGQTLTTDGPFPETKEVLGGYYLIEATDLDEAISIAAKIPAARTGGGVEVRPIVEM
ncbi:MAG TPA: YciI family protein [Gaiellaceae bacterium]|nr:YciI family protein [Gaiellaceae bacterium]